MTPWKVLHIVTQLELGGAQQSTLELLARLDRRRFQPALVSSDGLLTQSAKRITDLPLTLMSSLRRQINPIASTPGGSIFPSVTWVTIGFSE